VRFKRVLDVELDGNGFGRSISAKLQYNDGYETDYNLIYSILEFLSSSIKVHRGYQLL
ncbi:hypothetical protein MKX03_024644, partial [Papaver bracteatum]